MSSPASVLSGMLEGRSAKYIRRLFLTAVAYGAAGDYYIMRHYELFPREEAREYIVDCSPIGLPGPSVYTLPDLLYLSMTPWAPKNGDVVLGRVSPAHPQFMQLIGGRFVERESCGIEMLVPVEKYEELVNLRRTQEKAQPMGQDELARNALDVYNRTQGPDRR